MPALPQPVQFGEYLLVDLLNKGGMAEIYRALVFGVEGFTRQIVIKRILPDMAGEKSFVDMLIDEARITVQLSAPNIVQTYELGEVDGQFYIAMELVSGLDLNRLLKDLRQAGELLPVPLAAYILTCAATGLDHAHRRTALDGTPLEIVHRDVSPQNVLLSYSGEAKIADFGIARAADRLTETRAGSLKGKFAYMAPEQLKKGELTRAADIFALGVLGFEIFVGRRLFIGDDDFSVLDDVRNARIPDMRQLNPDIPVELESALMRALAAEPEDRYDWASDLADALQPFLIQGNTIVGSKQLAEFLGERYEQDRAAEQSRAEELQRFKPPRRAAAADGESSPPSEMPTVISTKTRLGTQVFAASRKWTAEFEELTAEGITEEEVGPTNVAGVTATATSGPRALGHFSSLPSRSWWPIVAALVVVCAAAVGGYYALDAARYSPVIQGSPGEQASPPEERDPEKPPAVLNAAEETEPAPEEQQSGGLRTGLTEQVAALKSAIKKETRRKGIIKGDLPQVDQLLDEMRELVAQGALAPAVEAGEKVRAAVKRARINGDFVDAKLARFNAAFDATKSASRRKRAQKLIGEIAAAVASGDARAGNEELNRGFRALRGKRP